jgi:hypothetical protein
MGTLAGLTVGALRPFLNRTWRVVAVAATLGMLLYGGWGLLFMSGRLVPGLLAGAFVGTLFGLFVAIAQVASGRWEL